MEGPVTLADLYLLDRWDHSSELSPGEQLTSIFAEFIRMGMRGRQTFANQFRARSETGSISSADQALLASVRPSTERNLCTPFWLRTCYRHEDSNSTDAAHEALKKCADNFFGPHANPYGRSYVFDDPTLYDFGSEDWQRIFTRIPEVLDQHYLLDADHYEKWKAEHLQTAIEADEQEDADIEEGGYTKSEDGEHWSEMFAPVHYAAQVGHAWIIDKEAITTGKLMIAWYDDCGRVVRYNRVHGEGVEEVEIAIGFCWVNEREVWCDAEIGPDYDEDGICGPPYRMPAAQDGEESR